MDNKELKALETLYNEREYLLGEKVNNKSKTWCEDIKHYDTIGTCLIEIKKCLERKEKLEKAIEIVKKRKVDFDALELAKKVENYNCNCLFVYEELTEEEFNLLKEAFVNE